jgi:putative oxidoreductase
MSTNAASLEAPRDGALWVVQALGAILFLISGLAKLFGDDQVMQTLAAIDIRQWFRFGTGLIEFAAAILLLIPPLSGIWALFLVPTMIGAILIHLVVIGGSPALPIGLLIVVSVVAWGRRNTTLRLIWRNRS